MKQLSEFLVPGKASVVVGGQFGSEAKGLVAASLALAMPGIPSYGMVCTTNAGAQAGHTTILPDGRKFVCYHLPTIGVLQRVSLIYLNAGSIIDPDLLMREIHGVSSVTGEPEEDLARRICIHPHAAIITEHARQTEKDGATRHVASTMKGVGAALSNKIMRHPDAVAMNCSALQRFLTRMNLNDRLQKGQHVTVEIPQGTGLSINNGPYYPTCTSRDCWLGQGLSDAGIHPSFLGPVVMVVRTFPIRVGHVVGGNSGPFYADGAETTWENLGVTPEITTVTRRVRRVAHWSHKQYEDALRLNRPDMVVLTFVNYLKTSVLERLCMMSQVEDRLGLSATHIVSWGPRTDQCGSVLEWGNAVYPQPDVALT